MEMNNKTDSLKVLSNYNVKLDENLISPYIE
jgi:hypothetical protein